MVQATSLPRNEAGIAAAIEALKPLFGDRLQTGQAVCEQHGHTTTWIVNQAPDAVAFPASTGEVAEIVKVCAEFGVPVIPLAVRQRMPILYYALAQIHEELKDMTIFQGLIGKKDSRYRLAFGRAMEFNRDDGSDAELTEMVREICETRAWQK